MNRINVTTWSDCEVLTRKCHSLVEALMKYQKISKEVVNTDLYLHGDQMVMVTAIELRDKLMALIDKSSEKNSK